MLGKAKIQGMRPTQFYRFPKIPHIPAESFAGLRPTPFAALYPAVTSLDGISIGGDPLHMVLYHVRVRRDHDLFLPRINRCYLFLAHVFHFAHGSRYVFQGVS